MIHFSKLKLLLGGSLLFFFISACQKSTTKSQRLPPAGCEVAWADSLTTEFVNLLELATTNPYPVWPDYKLGDGAVILNAGLTTDSTRHCLGMWQHGKLIDYLATAEEPRLSTPMYGYQLNFKDQEGEEDMLLQISQQPEEISNWINQYELAVAVLMPVDFPQFPFEISALQKTQIALHEAFHMEVMLPYWYTGEGQWPVWDEQPARGATSQCYSLNEEVVARFKDEKAALVELIEALLNDQKQEAKAAGDKFLSLRQSRYDLLGDFTVPRQDNSQCNCAEAENIMELEEGLADYGSWTMLYETGVSSREKLIQRYKARQQQPFYLTGAMLMHAIALMAPNDKEAIMAEIIASKTHEEGGLYPIFQRQLEAY